MFFASFAKFTSYATIKKKLFGRFELIDEGRVSCIPICVLRIKGKKRKRIIIFEVQCTNRLEQFGLNTFFIIIINESMDQ